MEAPPTWPLPSCRPQYEDDADCAAEDQGNPDDKAQQIEAHPAKLSLATIKGAAAICQPKPRSRTLHSWHPCVLHELGSTEQRDHDRADRIDSLGVRRWKKVPL